MLHAEDFSRFFHALWGYAPFPWQARLVARIDRDGRWPLVLDLPTGSGKTASLDVAVFLMALDAQRAATERRFARRVVLVIDRRVVVDQGYERAEQVRRALVGEDGQERTVEERELLDEVARCLRRLGGSEEASPLETAVLRGGMVRDDSWAATPSQPLVAVSTVDQVGSRLLFRGYGLSDSAKPIHAGLLGNDTLLLLDEVHLSQPFSETLEALQRYRGWHERGLPDTWQVVRMSATPGLEEGESFTLEQEDREHPLLSRRLASSKPVELEEVKVRGDEDARRQTFAEHAARSALSLLDGGATLTAVVVNRVDSARRVRDVLVERLKNRDIDVTLVTGRMRPLDRDDLMSALRGRVRSGRTRGDRDRPLILVGTQCVEAGADFDFDALVTECASLDALRQRFGRLDRTGELGTAPGVVLVRRDQTKGDDPVYGEAMSATWAWLQEQEEVDFGIERLAVPSERSDLLAPRPCAPVMLPAHLDQWVQTAPRPHADPDVSLWLHGPNSSSPDVQLVWRADIAEEELLHTADVVAQRVSARPPGSTEALSVPLYAARRWLQRGTSDIADVEGTSLDEAPLRRKSRPALRWAGDDSETVDAATLRPGDTLVVPSTYGGLIDRVWAPESEDEVPDLGDRVQWVQRGRPMLSLHLSGWWAGSPPSPSEDEDESEEALLRAWLEEQEPAGGWQHEVWGALQRSRLRVTHLDQGRILVGDRLARGREHTTEDLTSSFTARRVTLREHTAGVVDHVRSSAVALGLDEVSQDLALAARLHDLGKLDPRFQRMLHGGDAVAHALASEPLAKSDLPWWDRARRERARSLAGYPRGQRHEMLSVSLLRDAELLGQAADPDLVLHLIASHHGHARPFAPPRTDPAPALVDEEVDGVRVTGSTAHGMARLDSGVSDRFWLLVRRYGWHGLAWLEAVIRLADHRQSEQETMGGGA